MVQTTDRHWIESLVDPENGLVSREIFVSDELYWIEQQRVFARAWLFIGHESQVPNPGDFFVSRMGEESVLMARDHRGQMHVFLNTCRHRGMRVCRYDEGNSLFFTCPYHGWTYAADGRLTNVPLYKEAYAGRLDNSQWGLIEVPQMTNYKGTIWATWDRDAPSFLDYLGDMKLYLDALLDSRDGREGGSELIGGVQKWRIPCNWKFGAENFIGDTYHGGPTHISVDTVGISISGQQGRKDLAAPRADRADSGERRGARGSGGVAFPEQGHGARGGEPQLFDGDEPYLSQYRHLPVLDEYFRQVHEERQRRLKGKLVVSGNGGTIFPNMSFHSRQPQAIVVWHPQGPLMTEAWRFYLVDKDAPEDVKDLLRHFYLRYSGPGGMTEQDDMENWNYASAASKGVIARLYPYNYQMGVGLERPARAIHGVVGGTSGAGEHNQRALYRRWVQLMASESWGERLSQRRSGEAKLLSERTGAASVREQEERG